MSTSAILLMLLSMLIIWGGLVLAILNLVRRSPESGVTGKQHTGGTTTP